MRKREVLHQLSTNVMKTIIIIMFLATVPSGAEENQAAMTGDELLLKRPPQDLQPHQQEPPSEPTVDHNDGDLNVVLLPLGKPRPPRRSPPPPPPPPPPPAPFDFFTLALQWPRSWCNVVKSTCNPEWRTSLDDRFTIHGLWPDFKNLTAGRKKPLKCFPDGAFEDKEITGDKMLQKRLQKQWPNATFKKNVSEGERLFNDLSFWNHEWADHGNCAWIPTQVGYFEDTLNLFDAVDTKLTELLTTEFPRQQREDINVTSLRDKIREKTGHFPYMQCNHDPNNQDQLHEIHFWIRRDNFGFEDHPKEKNCKGQMAEFSRK